MQDLKELFSNLQCCNCGKINLPSEANFFERCGHFTCNSSGSCPENKCMKCDKSNEITSLTTHPRLLEAYTLSLEIFQLSGFDINKQEGKTKNDTEENKVTDVTLQNRTQRRLGRRFRSSVQPDVAEDSADVNFDSQNYNDSKPLPASDEEVTKDSENSSAALKRRGKKRKVRDGIDNSVLAEIRIENATSEALPDGSGTLIHREEDKKTKAPVEESALKSNDIELKIKENPRNRSLRSKEKSEIELVKALDSGSINYSGEGVEKIHFDEDKNNDEIMDVKNTRTEDSSLKSNNVELNKEKPRKRSLRSNETSQVGALGNGQINNPEGGIEKKQLDEESTFTEKNDEVKEMRAEDNVLKSNNVEFKINKEKPRKRALRSKESQIYYLGGGVEEKTQVDENNLLSEEMKIVKNKGRTKRHMRIKESNKHTEKLVTSSKKLQYPDEAPASPQVETKKGEPKTIKNKAKLRKKSARNQESIENVVVENTLNESETSPHFEKGKESEAHAKDNLDTKTDNDKVNIIKNNGKLRKNPARNETNKNEVNDEISTENAPSFSSENFRILWETLQKSRETNYSYRVPEKYNKKLARRSMGKSNLRERVNAKGETNLHRAVHQKNHAKIAELLCAGANPNVADYAGWTPLHDAIAKAKNPDIVSLLLEYGANAGAYGLDNETPLHLAVAEKNYEIIKILLDNGADPAAPDIHGTSPSELAAGDPRAFNLLSTNSSTAKIKSPPQICGEPLVIYFHGFTEPHSKVVMKFTRHFVLRETKNIYTASHIVVPSLDECSQFDWTLAQVMVKGSFICPVSWCEDSMAAGKILKPTQYHLHLTWMPGWRRARENTDLCRPGLLSGCHILITAPKNSTQQVRDGAVKIAQLRQFVKEAGGQLLTRMPDPESPYNPLTVPYHAVGSMSKCSQIVVYVPKENDRSIKYNMEHLKCLPVQWLIDSILQFQLEPYKN